MNRRSFLRESSLVTGGLFLCANSGKSMLQAGLTEACSEIRIETPIHGAILNWRQGEKVPGGLKIKVEGVAPMDRRIIVNGVTALRDHKRFTAEIVLRDRETTITAASDDYTGLNSHSIRVLWDKNSVPRYGFNIDDNIFFLRDIARKRYASLFDCFYLEGLRKIHREYGTKFQLNVYYSDGLEYTDEKEFTLRDFPDRYKGEWRDNSDWLKLAFHAYANKPDRPYQYAAPEKMISDFDLVTEQIIRFAGEETYGIMNNIHWDLNPSAFKPLAEKGVRVLGAYFAKTQNGWDIHLGLDDTRSQYLSTHDMLKDFDSGIVFCKNDLICNSTPLDQIVPTLESLASDPNTAEIMDILTHEQYFWPFYEQYLPDHFQRLERTISWLTEHGYQPVLWNDGFMGVSI